MRFTKVSEALRCDACHQRHPDHNIDIFTNICDGCLPVVSSLSRYSIVSVKASVRLLFLDSYIFDTKSMDRGLWIEFAFSSASVFFMSLIPYVLAKSNGQELPIFSSFFMFGIIIVAYFIQKYIDIFD